MDTVLILCATALIITVCLCLTVLRAWNGWLDLRRTQLISGSGGTGNGDMASRIELAAVRERLKRLEAIASGVDP